MKITFIIPPCYSPDVKPAERTAGCTRIVYPAPNIYELTVMALLERDSDASLAYRDFVYHEEDPKEFSRFLHNDDSDLYCIWSVNLAIADDLRSIEEILKVRPTAKVAVMGPAPTYYAQKFVTDPRIFALRGEPEYTLLQLTYALQKKETDFSQIEGLTWKDSAGTLHANPSRPPIKDIDLLPPAARHFLQDRQFHNPKLKTGPYTTMITSRSCPFKCIYCVPSSLTFAREIDYRENHKVKPPVAFRSVENVEQELELLARQGYKAIGFMDDNFIWNEKRTLQLCDVLKRLGFVWGCQARVDAITPAIAKALGESGCLYVDFGVESFNKEILEYIKKGITEEQIVKAVKMLQQEKVPVKLNVLIGCSPLETKATIKETFDKVRKLKVDQVMYNIVSPFPGTEFHKICIDNGWIEGGEYRPTDVQRESILNFPHLSAKEMEKALFRNNLRYFLSPGFVVKQMRRFSSLSEFISAAKALKIKLFG